MDPFKRKLTACILFICLLVMSTGCEDKKSEDLMKNISGRWGVNIFDIDGKDYFEKYYKKGILDINGPLKDITLVFYASSEYIKKHTLLADQKTELTVKLVGDFSITNKGTFLSLNNLEVTYNDGDMITPIGPGNPVYPIIPAILEITHPEDHIIFLKNEKERALIKITRM